MSYTVKIENDEIVKIQEDGTQVNLSDSICVSKFSEEAETVTSKDYPAYYTDRITVTENAIEPNKVEQESELARTYAQMVSSDYKERFKAEYIQLKIRLERLTKMCEKWNKDELDFKPTCPRQIYDEQMKVMKEYKRILEKRAELEKIDLNQ